MNPRKVEYKVTTLYDLQKASVLLFIFFIAFLIIYFVAAQNQGIFEIDSQTLSFINQALNATVLLMIPFILGGLGGCARILISGLNFINHIPLILASGLMSIFSWVTIKSGVLLSIVAPHLKNKGVSIEEPAGIPENFYTMALVAIFVGMFSTNIYIYINQRVEQLTLRNNKESN